MSKRTARLVERGIGRYDSAEEAWEALDELREQVDWHTDAVRPDEEPESEFRFPLAADD